MTYRKSARFYDVIYSFKDYKAEAEQVHQWIQAYAARPCHTLLDIGTGTGAHLPYLREHYTISGLDLSEDMLAIARQRLPTVTFHQETMVNFDLGVAFDAVTCLFSAIGYALTVEDLNQTMMSFAKHLHAGGVAIVEAWLYPKDYEAGRIGALFVDEPDIKISRMQKSERDGNISIMKMHHMVNTQEDGVSYFVEEHRMRMHTHEEYVSAMEQAGFSVKHIPDGLIGRSVYIGIKH